MASRAACEGRSSRNPSPTIRHSDLLDGPNSKWFDAFLPHLLFYDEEFVLRLRSSFASYGQVTCREPWDLATGGTQANEFLCAYMPAQYLWLDRSRYSGRWGLHAAVRSQRLSVDDHRRVNSLATSLSPCHRCRRSRRARPDRHAGHGSPAPGAVRAGVHVLSANMDRRRTRRSLGRTPNSHPTPPARCRIRRAWRAVPRGRRGGAAS